MRRRPKYFYNLFSKFQSTHPHGVRPTNAYNKGMDLDFNPRTRMGCDEQIAGAPLNFDEISIHAPAWGATFRYRFSLHFRQYFNPRTRMGCDGGAGGKVEYSDISIHAPAWGATGEIADVESLVDISIHAPAWGATQFPEELENPPGISIHAPAWGATSSRRRSTGSITISIHAPAWGATARYSTKF